MPRVSIVMPTYNQAKFIKQAIDSILAQTFADFELIVVNDGSADSTNEIVKSYTDKRIKYLIKENGGTGSALNTGFNVTSGEYETWFASDNVMFPHAIETLVNYLDTHKDTDFVYGNCEIWGMDDSCLNPVYKRNLKDEVDQTWEPDKLFKYFFLGLFWLWRRELRMKAGGEFQREVCEDYDMVLRMMQVGGRFAFLDNCMGWYRRHRENISTNRADDSASYYVQDKARARIR